MKKIILVGKAGSGKDFFRDFLKGREPLDVSYTTRPKRIGEIEGYTYNYISKEEFLKMKKEGKFLEAVNFNNWWYGTSNTNWDSSTVFIMTPSGTKHIPKEDRDNCIIIYFDIPIEIRRKRLSKRSDSDKVERRILADEEDFKNFKDFNTKETDPLFNCEELYNLICSYDRV